MRYSLPLLVLLGFCGARVVAQMPDPFLLQRTAGTDRVYFGALPGTLFVSSTRTTGDSSENRLRSGFLIDNDNRLAVTEFAALDGEGFKVSVLFPLFIGGELETRSQPYQDMLNKGKALPATVIAVAPKSDLAVIQLERIPDDAMALRLAKAPGKAGGKVLTLCAAFSTKEMWTYSPGIIAGAGARKWREEGLGPPGSPAHDFDCRVVQTEHFLERAQMGGPVVNERGEVIAMYQGVGDGGRTNNIDLTEIRALLASKEVAAITKGKEAAADKPERGAKSAPATAEERAKAKIETAAAAKLRLAKSLAKANKKEAAKMRCEELLKAYPETEAATEARKLLEELEK